MGGGDGGAGVIFPDRFGAAKRWRVGPRMTEDPREWEKRDLAQRAEGAREWETRVGSDRRADPKFRRAAPPGGKKDSHRDTEGMAESEK